MDDKYCFVIQPFQETFDKRFEDVYDPAIRKAGLKPYRVDLDPSTKILIDQIERMIKESSICLADISIDNPNVWYELGFAFASQKDVVMVCDQQRERFPFDVNQKSIITYSTDSKRDFENLENKISEKLKAFLSKQSISVSSIPAPRQETDVTLQPFVLQMLEIIIGEQKTQLESVSVFQINEQMNRADFTDAATSIGIRILQKKGFIECVVDQDWNGNDYDACRLTQLGEQFILSNFNLFKLSLTSIKSSPFDSDQLLF